MCAADDRPGCGSLAHSAGGADHVAVQVWAWRHPKPAHAQGRCIGKTDLPVDRRKAKRLAHRIRQAARRHRLPHVVHTSPLQRCRQVGRQLRRWGWRHVVDARLIEMDFGRWDGQPWSAVGMAELDAWVQDFAHARPGGGESLAQFMARVRQWWDQPAQACPVVMVAHAGWMRASEWLWANAQVAQAARMLPPMEALRYPSAAQWPASPPYGALLVLPA